MERQEKLNNSDIYPVITPELCAGRPPLEVLEAVLRAGAKIVQLRDKAEPERLIKDFRRITRQFKALLIINDSLDLALKYQADGVHLGQNDGSVKEAKKYDLIIGASSHNLKEALAAEEQGASYVNIGPIFATKSKPGVIPIGVLAIKEIALHLKIPFTVMGGINLSNLDQVLKAGACKVAMITALTQATDIEKTTREIIVRIRGGVR